MSGKTLHPDFTLSAQVLADTERLGSAWKLGKSLAEQHAKQLRQITLSPNRQAFYEILAEKSVMQQTDIENQDTQAFYDFIQQYR